MPQLWNQSPSAPTLVIYALVFFALKRLYFELTTGASRRALIKQHGCQPVVLYPHKGMLGKLFGLDTLLEGISDAKSGSMFRNARQKLFMKRHTVRVSDVRGGVVVTDEPEIVKTILSSKFEDFALDKLRVDAMAPALGHGIFSSNGAAWERSRALIRPSFSRSQVADLDSLEVHVQRLIDVISPQKAEVDLSPLFYSLTMDSATEFLFGMSTLCLALGDQGLGASKFVEAFSYCNEASFKVFATVGLSRYVPDRKWRRSRDLLRTFIDPFIQEALARRANAANPSEKSKDTETTTTRPRYVFLDELTKQTQDPEAIRAELLNVLLAGRDTTASHLGNIWFQLARRPDVWSKLQAEIAFLDGQPPDYQQLKDMKYLRYVQNETLRLWPLLPGNSRVAVRDSIIPLGGGPDGKSPTLITEGTLVTYHPYSFHRRADFYGDDAEDFRPERWEDLRVTWEYLPFNGGPRICPGQQFALVEAGYVTVRLMQRFPKVEGRDEREWTENMSLAMANECGCKVALFD